MIQPDDPNVQVIFVVGTLALYLGLQCQFWPWKTRELNFLDSSSIFMLIMIAVNVGSFMEPSKMSNAHQALMWIILVVIFVANGFMVFFAILSVFFKGLTGLFGFRYPNRKTVE